MTDAPSLALLMFVAYRDGESRVFEAVRAAGFDDLTLAQCRIAQRLSPNGIRVTDIAEQAQVTKQTAGAMVDELERAGYVTRVPDPTDARARLVLLSTQRRGTLRPGRRRGIGDRVAVAGPSRPQAVWPTA